MGIETEVQAEVKVVEVKVKAWWKSWTIWMNRMDNLDKYLKTLEG